MFCWMLLVPCNIRSCLPCARQILHSDDDIQNVTTNADFSDEVMAQLRQRVIATARRIHDPQYHSHADGPWAYTTYWAAALGVFANTSSSDPVWANPPSWFAAVTLPVIGGLVCALVLPELLPDLE